MPMSTVTVVTAATGSVLAVERVPTSHAAAVAQIAAEGTTRGGASALAAALSEMTESPPTPQKRKKTKKLFFKMNQSELK